jgi:hypothetical protein
VASPPAVVNGMVIVGSAVGDGPMLFTMHRGGREVAALAQTTKMGHLFLLDRETGKPLSPVEERPVPRWERPFGRVARLANTPGSDSWGSPNLGGAMATAGGLVFASGAVDERLHAFDVETGKELWSAQLPAGVHASPMTYVSTSGRQFVVVAAGGHRELHARAGDFDKPGDYIVAFALPSASARPSYPAAITAGHYEGHIVLDRTRLRVKADLAVTGTAASISLETGELRVVGTGKGTVSSDTLALDVNWKLPARNCGGTLRLKGTGANHDTAIIGELSYVDGCSGGGTKPGTFALWKGQRRESVIAP